MILFRPHPHEQVAVLLAQLGFLHLAWYCGGRGGCGRLSDALAPPTA